LPDEKSVLRRRRPLEVGYKTKLGTLYVAEVDRFLKSPQGRSHRGKVQLILTSPPFPLNRKKRYGNEQGEEFMKWLGALAKPLAQLLAPDGSIVMEMGNAWEPGKPVMSTLSLRSLLTFLEDGELHLCEQFVCHNPARLPSPAQWVNVERIRVKDAYTNVWWMAPSERPKANNRNVLTEYSGAMRELLRKQRYNAGKRPSGHNIGKTSFLKDNGGAIPSNVLTLSNTASSDPYRDYCRENELDVHPALMVPGLVEFFIRMLTDKGDLVYDPFAGSNTTGAVAERLGRRWIATEPLEHYVAGSKGRFPSLVDEQMQIAV
jgi:site-specific DNA-methyltransferase (cytosine-N4-specific)